MNTEPFDITAGERAHAIAEDPAVTQPIFDPTDPRCDAKDAAGEGDPATGARPPRSTRGAAGLRSDERRRPAR